MGQSQSDGLQGVVEYKRKRTVLAVHVAIKAAMQGIVPQRDEQVAFVIVEHEGTEHHESRCHDQSRSRSGNDECNYPTRKTWCGSLSHSSARLISPPVRCRFTT